MDRTGDDRYAKKWRALIGISLLSFVGFMDYAIVTTILPGIQADLLATVSQLQWVMSGFAMMLAMFMVTMGRVGDIFGRRRVLYIGVVVFGVASALAGFSPSPEFLIACRLLQGFAGAITFTCAASLLTFAFPQEEQGRALGVFMSITAFGMAIGPVLGGLFLSFLSWRWAFYVNVPVIIVGFLVCRGAVAETPRQLEERIDWWGLCFLVPGIGCLVTAIMQGNIWGWFVPVQIVLYVVTVVCVIGFIVIEQRGASPIIDLKLFRHPLYLTGIIAGLGLGGFIGIGLFLPPLYLINILGLEPYAAGLMLLPITGLVMIIPPLIGKWVDMRGPVPFLILGQILLVVAALAQMQFVTDSPVWFVLVALGLFGVAWGLQQASTANAVTAALPPESAGVAIGSLWTFWNISATSTICLGGLILNIVDKSQLDAKLAAKNITLSDHEQHIIRSLLHDPSKATEFLSELPASLSTEIAPLFRESFMAGYASAMLFLTILCAVTLACVLLTVLKLRRARPTA